eukprot:GEZU01017557.1.p1 GENE.GEZU01017557.1~~GEZU01017557.1.p1  ORF type:complete len:504 (-),score=32.65 GEZU01017557.1:4-1515(-)
MKLILHLMKKSLESPGERILEFIPLLQCFIYDQFNEHASDVMALLTRRLSEHDLLKLHARFLFHKQSWLRKVSAASINQLVQPQRPDYGSIPDDPFGSLNTQLVPHFSSVDTGTTFQAQDVEKLLGLLHRNMTAEIRKSAAEQIITLMKEKRLQKVFSNEDFIACILQELLDTRSPLANDFLTMLLALSTFNPARKEFVTDPNIFKILCRYTSHPDEATRRIVYSLFARLLFNTDDFFLEDHVFLAQKKSIDDYLEWVDCPEDIRNNYTPRSKYLELCSFPVFLTNAFVFRGVPYATYGINPQAGLDSVLPFSYSIHSFIDGMLFIQKGLLAPILKGHRLASEFIDQTAAAMSEQDHQRMDNGIAIIRSTYWPYVINRILNRLRQVESHEDFLSALLQMHEFVLLGMFLKKNEMIQIFQEVDWFSIFARFLKTVPSCPKDDYTLAKIIDFLSVLLKRVPLAGDYYCLLLDVVRDNLIIYLRTDSSESAELGNDVVETKSYVLL